MQDQQLQNFVLIDNEGKLLYSLYGNNEGNPLKSVISMLKKCM